MTWVTNYSIIIWEGKKHNSYIQSGIVFIKIKNKWTKFDIKISLIQL